MRVAILISGILFINAACRTGAILERGGTKKVPTYEIGYDYGCCGCTTLWYSIFNGNLIHEQFVFETACGMGSPTVFQFPNTLVGDRKIVKKYIAVSDSTAVYKFGDREKILLAKLDSIVVSLNLDRRDRDFKFSSLVGYREALKGEGFHPYWVTEKGKAEFETAN